MMCRNVDCLPLSKDFLSLGSLTFKWKEAITKLINLIGMHSTGGNSVEDFQEERER